MFDHGDVLSLSCNITMGALLSNYQCVDKAELLKSCSQSPNNGECIVCSSDQRLSDTDCLPCLDVCETCAGNSTCQRFALTAV